MGKSPRSAAAEQWRERLVLVAILKQQLSDLEALRKEVAEAEKRSDVPRGFAFRGVSAYHSRN